jgi:hypothetical protein
MHTVDGHDVEQAMAEMMRVLSPHDLLDWQARWVTELELLDDGGSRCP